MEVCLEQGTSEWKTYRSGRLGASDSPILLGACPFGGTKLKLWRQKKGLDETIENFAMRRGKDLESEARELFEAQEGALFPAKVVQCADYDWMIASLDGWNEASSCAIEIKCGGKALFDSARRGDIPLNYMIQMNHQMIVTDTQHVIYVVYYDGEIQHLYYSRDEALCDRIIAEGQDFMWYLENNQEPPSDEKDYIRIDIDETYKDKINYISSWSKEIKKIEDQIKECKKDLIDLSDDGNCELFCDGLPYVRITKVEKKGAVDYELMFKDLGISKELVESYRASPVYYHKVTPLDHK